MLFKRYKTKFAQCMKILDPIVKPDIIVTLKRNLDKVDKKSFHNTDDRYYT